MGFNLSEEEVELIKLILSERVNKIEECVEDGDYLDNELPDVLEEKSKLEDIIKIFE